MNDSFSVAVTHSFDNLFEYFSGCGLAEALFFFEESQELPSS